MAECQRITLCMGFTTRGELKAKLLTRDRWVPFTDDKKQGLYIVGGLRLPPLE